MTGISEILIPICACLGLIVAFCFAAWVRKAEIGTDKMNDIADQIRDGVSRFLIKEFWIFAIAFVCIAVILGLLIDWITAAMYAVGAILTWLAGFLGTRVTTWGNVRTVNAAVENGMSKAFRIAFRSGAVIGLCVTCLALFGLGIALLILGINSFVDSVIGFGFGVATMAFFGRVSGGVYTKAADIGEGLATKMEKSISDDDLKNPAVIADNVGDNVSNVAGIGFSGFETFACSLIAAILLAVIATYDLGEGVITQRSFAVFPLVIATCGVAASIIGIIVGRCKDGASPVRSFHISASVSAGIVIIASIILSKHILDSYNYSVAVIIGVVVILTIGKVTEYYTSHKYRKVKEIAEQAQLGTATSIISGVSVGALSILWPIILLSIGTFASFYVAGFYGIALAAVGMLSISAVTIAINAFGSVSDNADGIAEMVELSDDTNNVTNELDSVGNMMSAICKGFSIAATTITSVALLLAYAEATGLTSDSGVNLLKPIVIIGVFVGAMLPFLVTSVATDSVIKAVKQIVIDIKKQFTENEEILKGITPPNYDRCLDVHMDTSIKSVIIPGVIAIIIPVAVGMFFGTETLGGLLCGVLASGIVVALLMVNSGGAWDNAKKYIEEGNFGGKGSKAFKSAVTSDMTGDSFKDLVGPSINIMIVLMLIVAITFAPIISQYGGILSSALGY